MFHGLAFANGWGSQPKPSVHNASSHYGVTCSHWLANSGFEWPAFFSSSFRNIKCYGLLSKQKSRICSYQDIGFSHPQVGKIAMEKNVPVGARSQMNALDGGTYLIQSGKQKRSLQKHRVKRNLLKKSFYV